MSILDEQARESLSKLVEHIFAHRGRPLRRITYQELAKRINRLNKNDDPQARGMGQVLGRMGHLLDGFQDEWGKPIPHIQGLVVNKTGSLKNLPDEGIREFWPDYEKLTHAEKEVRTQTEIEKVAAFGSRWNDVLVKLGLAPILESTDGSGGFRGTGGESEAHKRLKGHVQKHPELVGLPADAAAFVEYSLPTLDEVDVLFKTPKEWVAVEVKSAISDNLLSDYERGIYQTIKYGAVLKGMSQDNRYDTPPEVRTVLVLESCLPDEFQRLVSVLGVHVIEGVEPTAE